MNALGQSELRPQRGDDRLSGLNDVLSLLSNVLGVRHGLVRNVDRIGRKETLDGLIVSSRDCRRFHRWTVLSTGGRGRGCRRTIEISIGTVKTRWRGVVGRRHHYCITKRVFQRSSSISKMSCAETVACSKSFSLPFFFHQGTTT